MYLNRSMQELRVHRSAETPQTPHSTATHQPATDRARSDETEIRLQEKTIENLRCTNSKSQKEIDAATMKRQNLKKETEKLGIIT
jgi:hypothetical protein